MAREAVIVEAVRTPLGRRNGKLKDWHPVDLLAAVLNETIDRSGIDAAKVDDVITGCVSQVGEQSLNIGRNAWLSAGLPEEVPATTVDRQCGSSQQAAHFAAQGVISGAYDIAIACGVEHMTRVPMGSSAQISGFPFSDQLMSHYEGGLVPQGISAEIIAERWGLNREQLDEFSARSHILAGKATEAGAFKKEIFPIKVETEEGTELFDTDEGIRTPNLEKMGQLPPAFKPDGGVITAANSSQITDGAAALLITTPEKADELGLTPRARFVSFALAGTDPVTMLTGPIPATKKALERSGLKLEDIDLVEINEAFASVVLAWKKELGIDDGWFDERVNVHGGAIALGHPLGASGARLMTTLVNTLEQTGGRYGLQTMCEGGGLANATIIERIS
ncbi:MAG: acetyl-CoA acyltransferase [Actinomycetota bacterium]|jgi:acetyl-CoA acyltransferase|nr:acetyl-CoA acyltransferase [Actinomycetota bacterium]